MIFDITQPMHPNMAVWPGDSPFASPQVAKIKDGLAVNVSRVQMSSHTGTHVDAPYHFDEEGTRLDQMSLHPFLGKAQVISLNKHAGALTADDFAGYDLTLAPRLLLHTALSERDHTQFQKEFHYPSPDCVTWLAEQGIILYGTDAPSVDAFNSKEMTSHKTLLKHQITILEGIVLTDVPDGLYELIALPLKMIDGDGSPVRAILRTLTDK